MKAVAAGETIYVPEGEKDVDNLRDIRFAATTNPGGCKKWRSDYSEHLRGADVVVLLDNHLEGREHGDQVVASLRGIAERIRVLDIGKHWAECPDKGDISAWLAAGGSAEKLKAIVDALPEVPTSADNPISGKSWKDGLITARQLQKKQFKPVRIILPDLIPEGLTINAGKPKIGKSWLALDVCAAVADHRFVLGDKQPVQGDVLYLALEDNQRQLKKRMDKLMGTQPWPERLELHTEWKRLDQGGLDDVEEWCKSHPGRRLIWIDTLAKLRPAAGRNEQAYSADYRAIEGLQKLSGQYQVGIVLNHHLRKTSSEDDAFDDVSGTLGLTGAADTIVVMKRHAGMVKIYVRGRDIEEGEFAAEFNRDTCRWRLVGVADDVFRSQERQTILAALKDAPTEGLSISDIMDATQRHDRRATKALLFKMKTDGEVVSPKRGRFALPPADPLRAGDQKRSMVNGGQQQPVDLLGDDKALVNNTNSGKNQKVNAVNGICREVDPKDAVDRVDQQGFSDPDAAQPIDSANLSLSEKGQRKRSTAKNAPLTVDQFDPGDIPVAAADKPDGTDDAPGCDIPDFCRRCAHCHQPGGVGFWDLNGRRVPLHDACHEPWSAALHNQPKAGRSLASLAAAALAHQARRTTSRVPHGRIDDRCWRAAARHSLAALGARRHSVAGTRGRALSEGRPAIARP